MNLNDHKAQYRAESAAIGAILIQGKGLADTLRFGLSHGWIDADDRPVVRQQVQAFDQTWQQYIDLREQYELALSKEQSRRAKAG